MFQEVLRDMVERTDGAIASLLMGFDGIPVDSYNNAADSLNVESVGSEYGAVLGQIKHAASMLELGTAQEVSVQAANMTTVIRLLNDEYFVAMALRPAGNIGKARYLLRLRAEELRQALT
jgi:predicted regulator of Ras-like GTPase activity (Roadblock/LC7/MglB family)